MGLVCPNNTMKGKYPMELNIYCKLANGNLVSKREVDKAIELVASLKNGFSVIELSDEELFAKGNMIDAIRRFREKYDTRLADAKAAIDYLREE